MVILSFQPSNKDYDFRAILAGAEYRFDVHWNSREAAYFFSVYDVAGKAILYGAKVVLGVYFGRETTHPLFRDGVLCCRIPHGDDRREPQFDDMGVRVQVWYFTKDEVVETILDTIRRGG